METALPRLEDDVGMFYRPEGTVALLDVTRCLHYGSRPDADIARSTNIRLVVWFMYHSRMATKFPFSIHGNKRFPFHTLIRPDTTEIERSVLA